MPIISIRKPYKEIPYYEKYMTLRQARGELQWTNNHKCIDCNEQCNDCIIDYTSKIAIQKILDYLDDTIPKRKIKGYCSLNLTNNLTANIEVGLREVKDIKEGNIKPILWKDFYNQLKDDN